MPLVSNSYLIHMNSIVNSLIPYSAWNTKSKVILCVYLVCVWVNYVLYNSIHYKQMVKSKLTQHIFQKAFINFVGTLIISMQMKYLHIFLWKLYACILKRMHIHTHCTKALLYIYNFLHKQLQLACFLDISSAAPDIIKSWLCSCRKNKRCLFSPWGGERGPQATLNVADEFVNKDDLWFQASWHFQREIISRGWMQVYRAHEYCNKWWEMAEGLG